MERRNSIPPSKPTFILAVCRREEKLLQLLAQIAKSRLKQAQNFLEIAKFGKAKRRFFRVLRQPASPGKMAFLPYQQLRKTAGAMPLPNARIESLHSPVRSAIVRASLRVRCTVVSILKAQFTRKISSNRRLPRTASCVWCREIF